MIKYLVSHSVKTSKYPAGYAGATVLIQPEEVELTEELLKGWGEDLQDSYMKKYPEIEFLSVEVIAVTKLSG